jgi:hypothetical protein
MTRNQQIAHVRKLARVFAQIATSPAMEHVRQRWRDTYMLRQTDRAPVWLRLDPACLPELLPDESFQCEDPFLRRVERTLRIGLRQHEFGDDTIALPYWKIPAAIEFEGDHLWGVEIKRHEPKMRGGAWSYDPPIKTRADLEKLRIPTWHYDQAETDRRLNRYSELLDDILPVHLNALPPLFPGVGRNASDLIGLDGLLLNMALDPEMIHALTAFIRDSVLTCIDQVEEMGILTENNDEPIHFSESLKTSPDNAPLRIADLWFRTESQQFQNVGPEMWRQFCLAYQQPIMSRFKYVSYGCCEDLTDRIDDVLAIPNLRIFVNSPWTDLSVAAEKCRDRYCIIWRQKATDVVFSPDLGLIREHLEQGMKATQGCHRAIVLQEVATTNGNPQRLHDWVNLARDLSERLSHR